jgi:hypothetical protein
MSGSGSLLSWRAFAFSRSKLLLGYIDGAKLRNDCLWQWISHANLTFGSHRCAEPPNPLWVVQFHNARSQQRDDKKVNSIAPPRHALPYNDNLAGEELRLSRRAQCAPVRTPPCAPLLLR